MALPFYIKKDLKAKEEELWKFKIFHHAKIYNLPKKILSRQKKNYGNLKYFTIQKYIIFKKNPFEKIQNPKSFKILLL
jgi:hypothetical protein